MKNKNGQKLYKHHIIPKHAGGTDEPDNMEYVTIEEHAERHKDLYEKYGRWQDDLAYKMISGFMNNEEMYSYMMEKSRLTWNETRSVPRDDPTLLYNMSLTKRKNKSKNWTEERRKKLSEFTKGHKVSEEHRRKTSKALALKYKITDLYGNVFEIENLRQWARSNNLDQGNLTKVAQGKLRQYKGYKVEYITKKVTIPPKDELIKHRIEEQMTLTGIAKHYGVCRDTISKWLNEYNLV